MRSSFISQPFPHALPTSRANIMKSLYLESINDRSVNDASITGPTSSFITNFQARQEKQDKQKARQSSNTTLDATQVEAHHQKQQIAPVPQHSVAIDSQKPARGTSANNQERCNEISRSELRINRPGKKPQLQNRPNLTPVLSPGR